VLAASRRTPVVRRECLEPLVGAGPRQRQGSAEAEPDRSQATAIDVWPFRQMRQCRPEFGNHKIIQPISQPVDEDARHAHCLTAASEQVNAERRIALFCEAAADVSNVVVQPVDLMNHHHTVVRQRTCWKRQKGPLGQRGR
jgi:hypothetical protein